MLQFLNVRTQDSVACYKNEKKCGQAALRSEIFFTAKLKLNNRYDAVKMSIQSSPEECGLGYIDLYLIHEPLGGLQARRESRKAICDVQKEENLKSIGISTLEVGQMQEILDWGCLYRS